MLARQIPDYTDLLMAKPLSEVLPIKISKKYSGKGLGGIAVLLLLTLMFAASAWAQEPPSAPQPTAATQGSPAPPASAPHEIKFPRETHHFWDKENDWLFAGVGASRTLDYFSTLNFRRRGRDEVFLTNAIVDNHAEFAAIEAGGTGLSIGVSYLFHHYGHHRLERWTSIVHMSVTTVGAVHNYCLKTAHD